MLARVRGLPRNSQNVAPESTRLPPMRGGPGAGFKRISASGSDLRNPTSAPETCERSVSGEQQLQERRAGAISLRPGFHAPIVERSAPDSRGIRSDPETTVDECGSSGPVRHNRRSILLRVIAGRCRGSSRCWGRRIRPPRTRPARACSARLDRPSCHPRRRSEPLPTKLPVRRSCRPVRRGPSDSEVILATGYGVARRHPTLQTDSATASNRSG